MIQACRRRKYMVCIYRTPLIKMLILDLCLHSTAKQFMMRGDMLSIF